ncbi:hypothetical protein sos41_31800 [Alphaproteobacteria bacterium SO-S41]|nr:hypothetical protein sos41_31800 [Alphaproteobacteria bacterium SO-S41]
MKTIAPLLAALAACLVFGLGTAQASDPDAFLDCTVQGGEFSKTVMSTGEWSCAEMSRRQISSGAGSFPARIVRSVQIADDNFKTVTPQLLDGLELAFKTWTSSVDIGFPGRITILLLDPAGDDMPVKLPEHGAAAVIGQSECLIEVNLAGITTDLTNGKKSSDDPDAWIIQPGASEIPRQIQKVVAHEAAHCVQTWRNPKQAALTGKGADWWMEGSAEMMASLVVPRANTTMERYKQFDKDSGELPLTTMSYQSIVFWQWLWNQSPQKVLDVWSAMPTAQPGAPAQALALKAYFESAMPKGLESFQDFAQSYLDGKITDVTGAVISAAEYGEPLQIDGETGQLDVDMTAFTIYRRQLLISGGDYKVANLSNSVALAYAEPGAAWAKPVPEHTPPGDCSKPLTWNVALMPLEPVKLQGLLSFTRDKPCTACIVTDKRDQCLAGLWRLDKPALTKLLVTMLAADANDADPTIGGGDFLITFDGTGQGQWSSDSFQIFTSATQEKLRADIWIGTGGDLPIKWSSFGNGSGNLKMCRDPAREDSFSIQTMVTMIDRETQAIVIKPVVTDVPLPDEIPQLAYACNGDTVTLTAQGTGATTDPQWVLHRVK